jgi:hypothetical protein
VQPTPTPSGDAPEISHLGLASAEDFPLEPSGLDPQGRPVFVRPAGHGFTLIVEGRAGRAGPPAEDAFRHDPQDPSVLPGLQVILSRALGDGSSAVCDDTLPNVGGVPATEPLAFAPTQAVTDAINDLGCRVRDRMGRPEAYGGAACTRSDTPGVPDYVGTNTRSQFCLPIAKGWAFAAGDTIVAARVANALGAAGEPREIVVRVMPSGSF